jgi:hypothetical protein
MHDVLLWMPLVDQHYDIIVSDIVYETPCQFSTELIDKTEYGDYTAIKQQLRRFLDEVYMLQQHPFYLGLAHSSRV